MKKRIITAFAALVAVMLLAVSCNQEAENGTSGYSTVLIKPVISESKALTSSAIVPTRYTYTATQNFSSEGVSSDLGGTGVEKDLTKGSGDVYATADRFAQGKWTFTVKGYVEVSDNPDEDVFVYQGSAEAYLTQSEHTVYVPMTAQFSSDTSVKGSVTVTPTSIRLADGDDCGRFEVKILTPEGAELSAYNTNITAEPDPSDALNNVKGTGTIQLPEGRYIMTIRYVVGTDYLGPAQVAIKVKSGIETTVSGKVESGSFTTPSVNMRYLGGTLAKSSSADSEDNYTFTFTPSGVTTGLTYRWYVNGAVQTTSVSNPNVFKFGSGISAGVYYVTCVVSTGEGASGDIFSATEVLYLK